MLIQRFSLLNSEYTITELDLEEFKIGCHDLNNEFEDHIGEYCWIRITTN